MTEVKSFIKWLVEEKKETPTIDEFVKEQNYLRNRINDFIKEAYEIDDLTLTLCFETIRKDDYQWKTVFIEFYRQMPLNAAHVSGGITFENGVDLKIADVFISQVIYNFVIAAKENKLAE